MTAAGNNPVDPLEGSPTEERLGELINEFFDRREKGENLTEEGFLAEYPEHAEVLREHLRGLDLLGRLGSSGGQQTQAADALGMPKGSSAEDPFATPEASYPEISGYKILKQIGRGGMGVVFKAVQLSTKRLVALKVLLEGPLASESSRRRFEREIALAAQLRHPNIIPIYDSGAAGGRMYYAMEHVFGQALSAHIEIHEVSLPAKLRLFVKICNALSHAHQRGVIHRDLKPSNILVDSDGEPHVFDFGLAKAGAFVDTTTSVTAQIVGTPAYMSPEQAAGDPSAIDTRTDVYSLGIVLYEVLVQRMPYDTGGALGKVLQNVAQAEPTPPNRIDSRIGSELSAIVLKALEKSKESRYQSVDAFSSDIQRYLAGEPISAQPASGLYLLRKVAWKYRRAGALGAGLLIFGAATFLVGRFLAQPETQPSLPAESLSGQVSPQTGAPPDTASGAPRRDQTAAARRNLQLLFERLDPKTREVLEPFVQEMAMAVSRGEDPGMVILSAITAAARITKSADEGGVPALSKDIGFDLDKPFFPDPGSEVVDETQTMTPEMAKVAEAVETIMQWGRTAPVRIAAPTSGPASSRPTTAEPAAVAPSVSKPPTTMPVAPTPSIPGS